MPRPPDTHAEEGVSRTEPGKRDSVGDAQVDGRGLNTMGFRQTFSNPFYLLLVLAGIAFSLTACSYGVMTVRGLRVTTPTPANTEYFMSWMDEHGFPLMMVELAVLGVFCFLAMATDSFWEKRNVQKEAKRPRQANASGE